MKLEYYMAWDGRLIEDPKTLEIDEKYLKPGGQISLVCSIANELREDPIYVSQASRFEVNIKVLKNET